MGLCCGKTLVVEVFVVGRDWMWLLWWVAVILGRGGGGIWGRVVVVVDVGGGGGVGEGWWWWYTGQGWVCRILFFGSNRRLNVDIDFSLTETTCFFALAIFRTTKTTRTVPRTTKTTRTVQIVTPTARNIQMAVAPCITSR